MNTLPDMNELAPDDIVLGLSASELVKIRKISPLGENYLVEGEGCESHKIIRCPLSKEEFSHLTRIRGDLCTYDGDPDCFLLGVEAERIHIAHQFDPLFAVNSSIVDPLPHQIEAVYRYLLPLPRIRFLLADDTGAGKTIMAGLLIKELLFRDRIQKILIITPGGLTKQWAEEELHEKFGLNNRLVNRANFDAEPHLFSRSEESIFVTSIDFIARNEGCLNAITSIQWDLIIVDEAHKLSAYEYGKKLDESQRYKAVKRLSDQTDHLLFLTATPHRGRKDTFRRLLLLLDKDLFQKDEHVDARIKENIETPDTLMPKNLIEERQISGARNRFFLRRLKEEMVDWEGNPLFKNRYTKTMGYQLTPEEIDLYKRVTRYVNSKRKIAKAKKNRNVELTLLVMQRRLASSLYAITRTLERRMDALIEVLSILRNPNTSESTKKKLLTDDFDSSDPSNLTEYEDLTEDERERIDKKIFRQVLTTNPHEVEDELKEIRNLFNLAKSLKNHTEAKFNELLSVLESSDLIRSDEEKLLIFTEHKDTLKNLVQRLNNKGYSVTEIHGGMDVDSRKKSQFKFRNEAKIMVATDAAGEGINLQFCRFLINWDLPWNPNRLEQRMGRIHRYGQVDDVWVFNLVAQNTREGAVLEKILTKMDTMRNQMGSDRVYDVIDDLMDGVPLATLIENAIDSDDEYEGSRKIEFKLESATQEKAEFLIDLHKKPSLASRLDLHAVRQLHDQSYEKKLQPLFIEKFFEKAWSACGGTFLINDHPRIWHISPTPAPLINFALKHAFVVHDHYKTPFVFDKQLVSVASKTQVPDHTQLLGPRHPLFDVLISWAIDQARIPFAKGSILIDPNITKPLQVWLLRFVIEDQRVRGIYNHVNSLVHERLSLIVNDPNGMRTISPSYLLNCVSPHEPTKLPEIPNKFSHEIVEWAYQYITEPQLEEAKSIRSEECNLRRKYLKNAFSDVIRDLQAKLNNLQHDHLFGEDNASERERVRKRINDLESRRTDRLDELNLMEKLSAKLPDLLTEAIIVPAPSISLNIDDDSSVNGFHMHRDDEVEAIAMSLSMQYESDRGWTPIDVSQDGEHYDIRSESPDGLKRFIEVKGRAKSGMIILTEAEYHRLHQLGDRAWLYIITYCRGNQPKLTIIQDPGLKLNPTEMYRQVQYAVTQDDWGHHGEEISL